MKAGREPEGGCGLETQPGPELNSFARWFADWWLRRGRDLAEAGSDDA
jgi:hypothetical protein